jgi:hypothetical protein
VKPLFLVEILLRAMFLSSSMVNDANGSCLPKRRAKSAYGLTQINIAPMKCKNNGLAGATLVCHA